MTLQDRSRAQAALAPSAVVHAFPALRRAAVCQAGRRQQPPQDPAFRAIERLCAASAAFGKALERNGGSGNVSKRTDDRYEAAMQHLLATRPATRAGLLALLRYARESKDVRGYLDGGAEPIMILLESIEASCATLVPARPAPTYLNSDVALLEMGELLKKLFAKWMIAKPDAESKWLKADRLAGYVGPPTPAQRKKFSRACKRTGYTEATNRCDRLLKKILALTDRMLKSPAHTAEGRAVQASAALTHDDTFMFHICDGKQCVAAQRALWGIALDAGFAVPAWFRKCASEKRRGKPTVRKAA
jgi:hypothetical protein